MLKSLISLFKSNPKPFTYTTLDNKERKYIMAQKEPVEDHGEYADYMVFIPAEFGGRGEPVCRRLYKDKMVF